MATESEGTLAITAFAGISRYFASPNQPPNKLNTIQNLYSPNRGELAYTPGSVTASISSPFNLMVGSYNLNGRLVLMFEHAASDLATPSGFTATVNGTVGAAITFYISYTGLGQEGTKQNLVTNIGSVSTTINFGTIPAYVSAVNIYTKLGAQFEWLASVARKLDGTFVSNLVISAATMGSLTSAADIGSDAVPLTDTIATFTITSGFNGAFTESDLVPGTTYFFALCPYVRYSSTTLDIRTQPVAQTRTASGLADLAYTLPVGHNYITITATMTSGQYDGTHAYTHLVPFMGTSAEDLMVVPNSSGALAPVVIATINSGFTIISEPRETNLGTFSLGTADGVRRPIFYMCRDLTAVTTANVGGLVILPRGTLVFKTYAQGAGYAKQIFPVRGANQVTSAISSTSNICTIDRAQANYAYAASITNRLFFCNGYQQPFYIDGHICKPIAPDWHTADFPITKYITAFKAGLIMAGGESNTYTAKDAVYYTALASGGAPNVFSISDTVSATPIRNSFSVLSAGGGDIAGFGIFSYNESTGSQVSQLVIGKQNSVFISSDPRTAAQEVAKNVGFISPNSFVNTSVGAFFLGRENFYKVTQGGYPIPIGIDIANIIKVMEKTSPAPQVIYHQGHVKILYTTTTNNPRDTELWCDVQLGDDGQPRMVWTGPHTHNSTKDCVVFPFGSYDSVAYEDLRVGVSSATLSQLDRTTLTSQNGSNVTRQIVFNDLTLQASDFIKILTRLYLRCRKSTTASTVTITFSLVDQNSTGKNDGTGTPTSYSTTLTLSGTGTTYQTFQRIFDQVYRGTVVKDLTLSWSAGASEETINIYEIALLFRTTRNREI